MKSWEMTIEEYLDLVGWYEGLPPHIQVLVEKFHPLSAWQFKASFIVFPVVGEVPVNHGDWFAPREFADDGTLVMAHFDRRGTLLQTARGIRPRHLTPMWMH